MPNTHYAVVVFSGDPDGEHEADDLRGRGPLMDLIAGGSEEWCWKVIGEWTERHPLRKWEDVEVLARDPQRVADDASRAAFATSNPKEKP